MKIRMDFGFADIPAAYYKILFHPSEVTGWRMGMLDAVKLYYKLAIAPLALYLIVGYLSVGSIAGNTWIGPISMIIGAILGVLTNGGHAVALHGAQLVFATGVFYILVMNLALSTIYSIVYHLIWKNYIHQFRGPYNRTFTAFIFGSIPATAFTWIIPSQLFNSYAVGIAYTLIVLAWAVIVGTIAMTKQQSIPRKAVFGGLLS